ncbi:Uncharacterized acyl-CoA thioester hydrolase HI_0827 [Leclercia adecarboxylata]|uniref:Uncharacterized acyl-CoA thioester hydrolase HI_0827 n=1 Tax=Leclercia adecarboxylata TaxID=83655 RepID=A0A4U9HZL4_9ENTR|nr:Uncharacterized acyl-CoA thioester hydrolase HI_0827 [Leclercia adecarboxylata]
MTTQDAPQGELVLRTLAMPADTNANGDIFGGWLMSQMDMGGAILAKEIAQGPRGDGPGRRHDFSAPCRGWGRGVLLRAMRKAWEYLGVDQHRSVGKKGLL